MAWNYIVKGGHARAGLDGVGKQRQMQKLLWCVYESLRKSDADFLVNTAQTIWLARDARRQRLLIRFRAVGFQKGEIVSRIGVLGQLKDHATDAKGIMDATIEIVRAAVSEGHGRPIVFMHGSAQSASQENAQAASEKVQAQADIILNKIEAITVDSASDELLAGEMMRGRCNIAEEQVICPNMKLVVRDKTHASRRTIQKPESCDVFLETLVGTLFKNKHSITQIINNSHVWSSHFAGYVADIEDRIGKGIKNVRGAKHRHESLATPRGRFVLYMDAYLQVAMHMLNGSNRDAQKHAAEFLNYINEEVALQAAMLADACDEGLLFTRTLDNEGTDPAELQHLVQDFVRNLHVLFIDGMCLELEGTYTNFMLTSLQTKPRVIQTGRNGNPKKFGGNEIPNETIEACLNRMVRYVKLATAVTVAEFPSFDLFCAFQVLKLQKRDEILAGNTTRLARLEHEDDAQGAHSQDKNIKILADCFHLDESALKSQLLELKVCAQKHISTTHCGNATAWREAVRRYSTRRDNGQLSSSHSLQNHPYKEIIHVIMRYVCFSISTAGVEQSFSVLKRTLGDQGLGGSSTFENQMAKLILTRNLDQEKEDEILKRSQMIYVKNGNVYRGAYRKRRDEGQTRMTRTSLTRAARSEKQWIMQRRLAVQNASRTKRSRKEIEQVMDEALDDDSDDNEAGEKLRKKQRSKLQSLAVEAYRDGVLQEDIDDIQRIAKDKEINEQKREKDRQTKAARLKAVTGKANELLHYLHGSRVHVSSEVDEPGLSEQLRRLQCQRVERDQATVFVVKDVMSPGRRSQWSAVLNGGFLVTPRAFINDNDKGPILKYCKLSESKTRYVHMTKKFKEKHEEVFKLMSKARHIKILETSDAFMIKYQKSKPANRNNMALLKSKSEVVELEKHVYTESEYLTAIMRVDRMLSKMGICKR